LALSARSFFLVKPTFDFGLNLGTFMLVFFAPVTEELFWRGFVLQAWLADARIDATQAIISNTFFFVLMHLPRTIFLNDGTFFLISLIPYGFLFAVGYYVSRSVYYPTVMHIVENVFSA
jgi:membrane protease YdiL (CAAX protease family)